jgi:hypothetical protein
MFYIDELIGVKALLGLRIKQLTKEVILESIS